MERANHRQVLKPKNKTPRINLGTKKEDPQDKHGKPKK